MDYTSKTGSGKRQPSFGSGCPSTPAIGLHRAVGHEQQKSPEDQLILRAERVTPGLAASASFRTATLRAMTSYLPAVMAIVITALIAIVVARGDIHDRAARCDRTIHDDRRATHHGWRARWDDHRDWTRSVKDWQPEREVNRNSCLGGAGQSERCNHCYQTEQMFCFHGGSDGVAGDIFDSGSLIKTEDY